ncbi:hypothetical protein AAC387_Pa05g1165 [Persea americana]
MNDVTAILGETCETPKMDETSAELENKRPGFLSMSNINQKEAKATKEQEKRGIEDMDLMRNMLITSNTKSSSCYADPRPPPPHTPPPPPPPHKKKNKNRRLFEVETQKTERNRLDRQMEVTCILGFLNS